MTPRPPDIVIVDHDLEALRALVEPLRSEFEFYLTISGNDALAMLGRYAIGVLVAGQTLFSGSGIEILIQARRRSPRTARVLLANAVERKTVERIAAGAELFQVLKRPCTTQQLKEVLHAASWSARVDPNAEQVEHVVLETGEHRQVSGSASGAPVTVLTTDADLFEAIRSAVHEHHDVHLATRSRDATQLAAAGQCAVLVTDQALTQAAVERTTHDIKAREPALVTIAAGNREQGNALMGLLGTGAIHRFLLKPVTPGLARLAIDSAARQHSALKAHPRPEPAHKPHPRHEFAHKPHPHPEPPHQPHSHQEPAHVPHPHPEPALELRPISSEAPPETEVPEPPEEDVPRPVRERWVRPWMLAGAGALSLLAIAAALWWWRSSDEPAVDPRKLAIDRALTSAEQAYRAGDYVEPAGASALFFYTEALELDAGLPAAVAGLDRIADHFIQQAETLMVEGELDAAAAALAVVRGVRPEHRRLRFLDTQLKKDQQDRLVLQARQSATEGDLREAEELLTQAEQVDAGSSTEVAAAQAVVNERERSLEVGRLIDTARQRLTQGRLVTPADDSAKFYLRSAQRAEPKNLAVQQGMHALRERVVGEADTAIEAGQLDTARNWIREARGIEVEAAQITRLQGRLADATDQKTKSDLLALTVRRTQENRLLEPAQDSARFHLARLNQMDPAFPGLQNAVAALGVKLVAGARTATAQRQFDNAARLLGEARAIGYNGADLAAAESALRTARLPASASAPTPPQAAPKRTKYIAPKYPQDALEDGIEGWVDVSFSVTPTGDVTDVRVEAAEPRNRFDRAAMASVRQWKFESRDVEGYDSTQRVKTRVQFELAD